jgi:hypothetical protein
MVEREDQATSRRRARMDSDYKLQRGDPYDTNVDAEGTEAGTDFKSFTSNEAGALVRKVVAFLAGAQVLLQVPYGHAQRAERGRYDLKERFALGLLDQADDLLAALVEIPLRNQLAWFSPNRGWVTVRALLMNRADGTTVGSARPWDPRNVYWQVGGEGLLWACHRTSRPAAQILSAYPEAELAFRDEDELLVVYDMYTENMNAVMTPDVMLKPWTPHGSPRVPVVIVPVPLQPNIWSPTGAMSMKGVPESTDDYGESVLATNRPLYNHLNEVLSVTLELMAKAREPGGLVFTDEEDTELEEHPSVKSGVQYLGREDKYQAVPPPETTKDALQLLSAVTAMLQRGGLPYSTYGELSFAISGYAITQLNQQILTVLGPQTQAIQLAMKGIVELWVDQFVSGQFNPVVVRGLGRNKDYMQVTITPDLIANLPPFKVEMVAQLPQDDVARLAAAQQARAGELPFLPDRWLWENFLHLPDTALIDSMLKEQLAERSHPAALALALGKAAMERGEKETAKIYLDEYFKFVVLSKMGGGAPGAPGGTPGGGAPGLPPTVLSFMAQRGSPGGAPNAPTGMEGNAGFPRRP